MSRARRPHICELSRQEHEEQYLAYRVAYLPRQIEATERKLAMLRNEARRYGLHDLVEDAA